MSTKMKSRKVKAKITRTVTEIAIVLLNDDGNIESVEETLDELDYDNAEIISVIDVISIRS